MSYKVIFEAQFLHRYFLDHGQTHFDIQLPFADNKKFLAKYFMQVAPLQNSKLILKNHRWLFKQTPLGFAVLSQTTEETINRIVKEKPIITPAATTKIVFAIRVTDPMFYSYTNSTQINDFRLYHFTNTPTAGLGNIFDNSGVNDVNSDYLLNETDSGLLLKDVAVFESESGAFTIENVLDVIDKDDSIIDKAVAKANFLANEVKQKRRQGIIGYITIDFSNNQLGERILEHALGEPQYTINDDITFKLIFQNSSAIWRYYIQKNEQTFILETQNEKRFSANGYTDIDVDVDLDAANQLPQGAAAASAPTIAELNSFNFPSASPQHSKIDGNGTYSDIFIYI